MAALLFEDGKGYEANNAMAFGWYAKAYGSATCGEVRNIAEQGMERVIEKATPGELAEIAKITKAG